MENRTWLLQAAVALALCGGLVISGCKKEDAGTGGASSDTGGKGGTTGGGDKKITVGFAQVGAESGWRTANSQSIQGEAAKRGINLKFANGEGDPDKQIAAIKSFISQKVDVIGFSPKITTGWDDVLKDAKDAGIPVILTDRAVDTADKSLYVTFIGSDFVEEGHRAGRWALDDAKAHGNKDIIVELEGSSGAAPAIDRKAGFDAEITKAANPDIKVIISQTGDFDMTKGKKAMEAILATDPEKKITMVFAHNDEMAIGAVQALEAAGRNPGKDVRVVSIDGQGNAFAEMGKGHINCIVECRPLIGPMFYDAVEKVLKKEPMEKRVDVEEGAYSLVPEGGKSGVDPNHKYMTFVTPEEATAIAKDRPY
jgi:simple sugar transport system substrate-binding protein